VIKLTPMLLLMMTACAHEKASVPVEPAGQPEPKAATEQKPVGKGPTARPSAEPGRPTLAASPTGLMIPEGALMIQKALTAKGYLSDHQTNTLDEETSAALRKFQGDQGMARTGAPDRETLRKLGISLTKIYRDPSQG
jgi:hypothetical protein